MLLVTCRVCGTCGTAYERRPGKVGVLNSVAGSAACVTCVSVGALFGVGSCGAPGVGPGTVNGNCPGGDSSAGAGSIGAGRGCLCAAGAETSVVRSVGRMVASVYRVINPINKQRIVYVKSDCNCIYVSVRQKKFRRV